MGKDSHTEEKPEFKKKLSPEVTVEQKINQLVEMLRDLPDEIYKPLLQKLGVLPNFESMKKEVITSWRPWIEKKVEADRLHIRVEGNDEKIVILDPTMSMTIELVANGTETSVAVRDAEERIAVLKRENHHLKLRLEAAEARLSALDPAVD